MYIMITYANPSNACHAGLVVAILAGFASGFIVTKFQMPIGWVTNNLIWYPDLTAGWKCENVSV